MRDLRHLVTRAVGQLGDRFRSLDARVAAYKEARAPDWLAHDVVIRAADCRAITTSQIPDVLKEWREPEHEAFRSRNAWSLFNAFTAVYREINPHTALRRGEALHGLFDAVVGLSCGGGRAAGPAGLLFKCHAARCGGRPEPDYGRNPGGPGYPHMPAKANPVCVLAAWTADLSLFR